MTLIQNFKKKLPRTPKIRLSHLLIKKKNLMMIYLIPATFKINLKIFKNKIKILILINLNFLCQAKVLPAKIMKNLQIKIKTKFQMIFLISLLPLKDNKINNNSKKPKIIY